MPLRTPLHDVLDAVWPGRTPLDRDSDLTPALALARANQVQGALARSYPMALAAELRRVEIATAAFDTALTEAAGRLRAHGVDPVLIKCVPGADHVYSNFDLVVGDMVPDALRALNGWGVRTSRHPFERTKVLVYPRAGPAAHLHREASWWDVPSVDGTLLRSRALDTGLWLVPARVDELRIWVAHALFQNLAVDLAELLALRPLLEDTLIEQAASDCRREGWERGFRRVVTVVRRVVRVLDDGGAPPVPLRLPMRASGALSEHVWHLGATGRPGAAVRESVLRGPLLLAKARRVRRTRATA